ncbi:MAG: hypothetical protein JW807_04945 [Spirochaetes bacterium]|nr:hypothetical protein [Spirochaetota bacterium]
MPKEPSHKKGMSDQDVIINIPDSVRKSLPGDFNISDIGKIDLREAETIAREDILFLTESDLIEGLEDFDLIPLKVAEEAEPPAGAESALPAAAREKETGTAVAEMVETGVEEEAGTDEEEYPETEPGFDDGVKSISLEDLDRVDDEAKKWAPLEKPAEAEEKEAAREPDITREVEPVMPAEEEATPAEPRERKRLSEGYVEGGDEYVIWDMADSDAVIAEPVSSAGETAAPPALKKEKEAEKKEKPLPADKEKVSTKEREIAISLEELDLEPVLTDEAVVAEPEKAVEPREAREAVAEARGVQAAETGPDLAREVKQPVFIEETAPPPEMGPEPSAGKVVFIEDSRKEPDVRDGIFDESELDKIITGMVQIDEGAAQVLGEAKADEDRERIAAFTEELVSADEDLVVDLEYKYGDDELDYIHTAIVEEDFGGYMREIDDYFGSRGGKTVPTSLELLGLTADEFDTIEDLLFKEEFKDIHLYDRYHLYEFDRAGREGSPRERKRVRYLLPTEHSLHDSERDSIESDVSSGSALIFEEDVDDIRNELVQKTGMTDAEVVSMVEQTFVPDLAPEESQMEETMGAEETAEEQKPEAALTDGGVFDITDRVVILDDEADVERFVNGFPEQKRVNIKMLLKYLDGLFERLPEEIIKKFASSEYFELYLKVLNELGV